MGSAQSSHVIDEAQEKMLPTSVRGRKSLDTPVDNSDNTHTTEDIELDNTEQEENLAGAKLDSEEDYDSDDDEDDDEEEDEGMMERLRILEDARNLKKLADFFLHPENPIEVDATATARCYFDRPSAEEAATKEEAEEQAQILEDAKALKKLAVDYAHPETPVTPTSVACSRCYFDRISADHADPEYVEERVRVMEDMAMLKKAARDYLHPEAPVETTDPCACGRNYFSRPSVEAQDDAEEAKERARILEDAMALKKLAVDYAHPELPVVTTDPYATGRNYFTRSTAPEYEDEEMMDDKEDVLEDAKLLKELAVRYHHPEAPIEIDPCAFGRNYFYRPSAPETEDDGEHIRILEEARALKKLAVDYMHPEMPVVTSSPFACGRNYFARPSAPEQGDDDEERERIMEETSMLKQLAVDYMHPERPVVTSDPCSMGRNYFDRPSAPGYDGSNDASEREHILEDAKNLKKLAVDYSHPELPVSVDPCACGRNYFGRTSAPEQEDSDDDDERSEILEEVGELKKLAHSYLHPEEPVVVSDPCATGRNFFDRPSAVEQETEEDAEERARILAEAKMLKQLAVDYLHPEMPVVASDPYACGRNFFARPSAPDIVDQEDVLHILEDVKQLKKLAVDYLHPENPVVTSDACAVGRNYFSRGSAPEQEDAEEAQEGARILEESKVLMKLAVDYRHPEKPVEVSDPCATGRNYFDRPSAPDVEEAKEAEERVRILEEAKMFKKFAVDYMHPEIAVKTTDAFALGRNFFDRASASGHKFLIHSEGAAEEDVGLDLDNSADYSHHYYDPHDDTHSHHSEHHDHFMMDEDMFEHMRQSIVLPLPEKAFKPVVDEDVASEEEGKLSRSPSSVMLFEEAF